MKKNIFSFTFIGVASLILNASAAIQGRYITIIGTKDALNIAEVQVFSGGQNIALKGKASQSSDLNSRARAEKAIDGDTNSNWKHGSIAHTKINAGTPAWEVDIGQNVSIDKVVIWNRKNRPERLHGAQVSILDAHRKVVWGTTLGKPRSGEAVKLTTTPATGKERIGQEIPPVKTFAKPVSKISRTSKKKNATVASGKKKAKSKKPKKTSRTMDPADFNYGTVESLRMAINNLISTFGKKYPHGQIYLKKLAAIEKSGDQEALNALRREALLANPLIDFDKILVIVAKGNVTRRLPSNWVSNSNININGHDNYLGLLSLKTGEITKLLQPPDKAFIGDIELHFDANRLLYSSRGANGAWGIFEVGIDPQTGRLTGKPRQITPNNADDIDYYEPCYLPDGRIIMAATSGFQGVPCVSGSGIVANLHLMDPKTGKIRRLTFDQDSNWNPTLLPNGRVLYLRWEYTDSAHYFARVLMHMNPDGTDQKEFYGSNSYWPNSNFFARPIPGSSSKFISIVSGHHGEKRMGELILFDNSKGRHEADGVIQRIPGHGKKVEPIIKDRLVSDSCPLFLHPWPLSENYHLVSMTFDKQHFALYLVDTFDNFVKIKEIDDGSVLEPIPLRKTPAPPPRPDRIKENEKECTFYIQDIYAGPGLAGVPRGTVKYLRVHKYEYAPRNRGGHYIIGFEGPWDVHVVLGTVPVNEDGSVIFKAPANTPVAFSPLDKERKALQLMRSWTVGMPGEVVSCVGCHEPQNTPPISRPTMASRQKPQKLEPWYGPPRGFSFKREVQPVLDKYCAGCHTPEKHKLDGRPVFTHDVDTYSYLHPYVRRNGPEGDYHLLTPLEFHANTSELIQLLEKGHHNVRLDDEAWDRIITWIDQNVPKYGTWAEAPLGRKTKTVEESNAIMKRRAELRKLYANVDFDPEKIVNPYKPVEFVMPPRENKKIKPVKLDGWPIERKKVIAMQHGKKPVVADIGNGQKIKFVYIPPGEFVMGSKREGYFRRVKIEKPFYMGATEISLAQYRQFKPDYKNGVYDMHYKDQVDRGYYMNEPNYPVIRVCYNDALKFCEWLSAKIGKKVTLPSEEQWEWACRAGTDTPFWYGDENTDFSKFANLADATIVKLAVRGVNPQPIPNPTPEYDYELKDPRFNDGVLHLANVGSYQPNPWGLYDMHGNVCEWTTSNYDADRKVIRGGSWKDVPKRATSAFRYGYPPWQRVYNTGFRVIIEP